MVRVIAAALLAAMLLFSGCIVGTNTTEGDEAQEPPKPVLRSDSMTQSAAVDGPQVYATETVVAGPWTLEAPADSESITATVTWQDANNAFRLRVTDPSDDIQVIEGDGQTLEYETDQPVEGSYTFEVLAEGLVMADTVDLEVDHAWWETVDGTTPALVEYSKEGDHWRATITRVASDPDVGDLVLDVDTFNGHVKVEQDTSSDARATVTAWGTAATKDRAAELARAVQVRLGFEADTLTATASDTSQRSDNEGLGASIDVVVPAAVTGMVDTSNGGITLTDIETTDLTVDTANGGITGSVTAEGDFTADTANGAIRLDIDPTGDLSLTLDTSNGGIDLTLKEASDIGYQLEADTSNGRITEDMSEASLSGESDDTSRTLETDGYGSRSKQVSGTVGTSNGNIEFNAA